jgi:hypothetical protein
MILSGKYIPGQQQHEQLVPNSCRHHVMLKGLYYVSDLLAQGHSCI